jgi:N6-L-threonylcarbamoyladenine synthase/protein kinase Bud32
LTSAARREGVPTPVIYDIDPVATTLTLERVGECDLVHAIDTDRCRSVGQHLAQIHTAGFVHGDPTVRNVRAASEQTYLIDFGLGYYTEHEEDHAMDLHVFLQSLRGATDDAQALFTACEDGYREIGSEDVLSRRHQIDSRGRYQ